MVKGFLEQGEVAGHGHRAGQEGLLGHMAWRVEWGTVGKLLILNMW